MPKILYNPLSGKFDYTNTAGDFASDFVKTDQTTHQHVTGGRPVLDEGVVFGNTPTVGAVEAGKLYWDSTYKTLSLNLDADTNLQIGQESVIRVIAGENIANGEAVYFSGSSGEFPLAMKAIANSEATARVKGIATEAITSGQEGFITNFGIIHGLNTNSWTAGDLVYLSGTTAGALTNVKPVAPLLQTVIGRVVVKDATNGSIYRSSSPNYPISGDQVDLQRVGASTRHSVQDWFNTYSVGMISGGAISDAGSQKIAVTAGTGIIAIGTSDTDPVVFANWAEKTATTVTDARVTWVTVQYNSGSPQIVLIEGSSATDYSVPAAINYQDVFPLGYVTRNGTELYISNNPRRIQDLPGGLSARFYQTLPLARDERLGGLILGEKGTRNITVTGGKIWDRNNSFTISAIDTSTGGAPTVYNTFSTYYRAAGSGFTETEDQTQWPNTKYDDGSGTLADVGANKYANLWWYLSTENYLACVYGRATYSNAASAAQGAIPATLPLQINAHFKLIARTTFQNSGGTFTAIDTVFTNTFAASAAATHNNLSGLQGGTAGEYYHITSAQNTVVGNTSGTNTGDNAVNSLYSGLVTNATHTGDVTGSGALTIANKVTMTATSPIAVSGTPTVIASSPVAITHATTAGNIHLPTGGTLNQLLLNSGTSGTGKWATASEAGQIPYFDNLDSIGLINTLASGVLVTDVDKQPIIATDIPTAVTIGAKYIYRADGTDVAIADGGTGQGTAQLAINALTAVSGATNEHVLTKDTATGNAIWKAGGSGGATTALDNLASVAVNTSIISDTDNTDDLGSTAKSWRAIYAKSTGGVTIANLANAGYISDGGGHICNNYPASVNADDDEFMVDDINSIAGGNFWEWQSAPGSEDVNSTVASHLFVSVAKSASDAELRGAISSVNFTSGAAFTIPCHPILPQSSSSDEMIILGLLDVSSGYYREIEVRNNSGSMTLKTWYKTSGSRTQDGSTITLGNYSPYMWLTLNAANATNHNIQGKFTISHSSSSLAVSLAIYAMGSGFDPDRVYVKFGAQDDAGGAANSKYVLDFFRRT